MIRASNAGYAIRLATVEDVAIIAQHRVAMFQDMGQVPSDALATQLFQTSAAALAPLLRDGSYVGWLALGDDGTVMAGAGAHVMTHLPRIAHDARSIANAPVPLVLNVYTAPAFRGRGIARALMEVLLEWSRARGVDRVMLHASDAGRPLYESLGFTPTNEMRWTPSARRGSRQIPLAQE